MRFMPYRTPAPALPIAPNAYSPRYHEQLHNVLRLYFNQLDQFNTNVNAAFNSTGPYITMPHAMLMSDEDQPNAGTTSENFVTYNQPTITEGIRVTNGSEIRFDHPGKYLITFSLQFTNRGNSAHEIEVWAKRNGVNYPLSNTRFDIAARKSDSVWAHAVASVNGIFDVEDPAADYLRMAWWSSGADVFLEHYDARTSPTRPEIPSVILTANYVSALP